MFDLGCGGNASSWRKITTPDTVLLGRMLFVLGSRMQVLSSTSTASIHLTLLLLRAVGSLQSNMSRSFHTRMNKIQGN
jgi:hypothetical protein